MQTATPDSSYIITGSGTAFTATKGGVTVGTADQPIQTVINAVRSNANGKACIIQFGDGTTALNTGTDGVSFNHLNWGAVTLTGKITSAVTDASSGTIYINYISVTSIADIANTSTSGNAVYNRNNAGAVNISGGTVSAASGSAVYNYSTGTVNISGGTVSATSGNAVYNNAAGAVNISGGTVSATSGIAVYNNSKGKITVSGTATKITSENTDNTKGTIHLTFGYEPDKRFDISGNAVVENTSTGNAIRNDSRGEVNIYSGTVSATSGDAVYNNDSGEVNIRGGTVSATSGDAVYNNDSGALVIYGGTVSATSGRAVYSSGIINVYESATITSANTNTLQGTIHLATSAETNGKLSITGGTVKNTSTGNAIRNDSAGAVNISGTATISKAGSSYYAIYNNSTGIITVGPLVVLTGSTYGNNFQW